MLTLWSTEEKSYSECFWWYRGLSRWGTLTSCSAFTDRWTDFSKAFSHSWSISLLEHHQRCWLPFPTTSSLQKLSGFKPSCLSAGSEDRTPTAYITRKKCYEAPRWMCVFTHQIHWGKQSSEEEKLHYKFSNGKHASFWDPGHSFLTETCCQCHIKGSICSSAPWQAWERLYHPLLWGAAKSQYL